MNSTVYLSVEEVVFMHKRMIERFGGSDGIRDRDRLESAVMMPRQTFDMNELYPTIVEKAAILCFGIISKHPFIDGNKRTGQHAMEVFLELNGHKLTSSIDEDEALILGIANGQVTKDSIIIWLNDRVQKLE
jgi:death-on-curing protein